MDFSRNNRSETIFRGTQSFFYIFAMVEMDEFCVKGEENAYKLKSREGNVDDNRKKIFSSFGVN